MTEFAFPFGLPLISSCKENEERETGLGGRRFSSAVEAMRRDETPEPEPSQLESRRAAVRQCGLFFCGE